MATVRPFRFGVTMSQADSASEWRELAREVEDRGFSTFLMPDHFPQRFAPVAALMAAADATSRLRAGGFVFDNDFRHPALLAKEAATLDVMTEGRFELGIGAGWVESEYRQTGIPFERPGVRVARMAEAVQVIKRVFDDAPAHFQGEYYTISGLNGLPKPVQRPHPPIMIAGGGRRLLSIAGREADIVGLIVSTTGSRLDLANGSDAATTERIEWIRAAAGERFDAIELNSIIFVVEVTDRPRDVAERVGREWGFTPEAVLGSTHVLIGSVDQIVESIQHRRERYGISYLVTSDGTKNMRAIAPVVARLAGT